LRIFARARHLDGGLRGIQLVAQRGEAGIGFERLGLVIGQFALQG